MVFEKCSSKNNGATESIHEKIRHSFFEKKIWSILKKRLPAKHNGAFLKTLNIKRFCSEW